MIRSMRLPSDIGGELVHWFNKDMESAFRSLFQGQGSLLPERRGVGSSGSRVFQLGRLVQLGVLGAAGAGLIAWLLLS